nr:hypothetical protein CFP56_37069 [Quercus suber]
MIRSDDEVDVEGGEEEVGWSGESEQELRWRSDVFTVCVRLVLVLFFGPEGGRPSVYKWIFFRVWGGFDLLSGLGRRSMPPPLPGISPMDLGVVAHVPGAAKKSTAVEATTSSLAALFLYALLT